MKKLIRVVALTAMAGCSSMSELRQERSYRSFSNTKGIEQVTECVLFAWRNQSLAGAHCDVPLQPLPGGGRTIVSQGQAEFVDVVSTGRGSDISIYFQSEIVGWRENSRIETVKSCL